MPRVVLSLAFALAAALGLLLGLAAGGRPPGPVMGSAAPPSFADIAQRVNPSVVNVTVIEDRPPATALGDGRSRRSASRPGLGFIVDRPDTS
jgi:S1-C subfamily serine protease